jgi:ABC-type branched-subunit amino acid transport system substrate-binding protein
MKLVASKRGRAFCALFALTLLVAACGNAGDDDSSSGNNTSNGGSATTFSGTDFTKHQTVNAKGVTDTEIHVGSVVSVTNPVGGDYGLMNDGISAYLDTINQKGGVWGRQIKLTSKRDDQTVNDATQVEGLLSQDNVYAAFIATQLFSGSKALAQAGIPTFGWNINAEWAGPKNFFPNVAPICFKNCTSLARLLPYAIKQTGKHKVALIGYNVPQSADSVKGNAAAVQKFGSQIDAQVVYQDTSLSFGATDYSAQVAQMKAKGADFLVTSLDYNGDYAIAKEMKRQGILDQVTFLHPNLYEPAFVAKNADVLNGGYAFVGVLANEHKPAPPALQDFLDYAHKNNVKISELSEQGWIAAKQFVDALKAAGPNFTWANLINAWNQQTWYSNSGMVTPIDWTFQHQDPSTGVAARSQFECGNFLKIENGKFVGVWDDGGKKPWVCFDGKKPDDFTEVNVSFAGKPFDITDVIKSN